MAKTVGEVAALAGVTVKALHHYDAIGLLRPSERTDAGYRLYGDEDLARLHDVLYWRSLGFPLDEVRALLDDPSHDPLEAMRNRRAQLRSELGGLHERLAALEAALAKAERREPFTDADLRTLLGGFDPAAYADEAEARWGHTDAWRESRARTARYGPHEWAAIRDEGIAVNEGFAALLRDGVPATSPLARAAAEAHRAYMSRWFYEVTPEIHVGLADTYVSDPRFAAHYEAVSPGLAAFVRDAILALHAPRARSL